MKFKKIIFVNEECQEDVSFAGKTWEELIEFLNQDTRNGGEHENIMLYIQTMGEENIDRTNHSPILDNQELTIINDTVMDPISCIAEATKGLN